MGHLTLDRLYGLEATLVLEPFRSSYVVLNQSWPEGMPIWPVVAGPLANIAVGVLLFVALWSRRNPYLLPLLMWGPIALIQEPTTALVQIFTREAGTDWVLIIEAGAGAGFIAALAVAGPLAGLAGLLAVLPTAGLSPRENLSTRLGVLSIGMGGFILLALGVSVTLGYPGAEVCRALYDCRSSPCFSPC